VAKKKAVRPHGVYVPLWRFVSANSI